MSRKIKSLLKNGFQHKWFIQNFAVFIAAFMVITGLSIAYAALNQQLRAQGDVVLRAQKDIRVDKITPILDSCGYDLYSAKYLEDSISVNLNLPELECIIKYEVAIKNNTDKGMKLTSITEEIYNNPDIVYEINGYGIGSVIPGNSTKTFTITFMYKTDTLPNSTELGATLSFKWEEDKPGRNTEFIYSGSFETFTVPISGYYKLEVWGASGGDGYAEGGKGGYSYGNVYLEKGEILYVWVGGQGQSGTAYLLGGFNGGGNTVAGDYPSGSGGGATDIRINYNELEARVIVAGGGGGAGGSQNQPQSSPGGAGGGTVGLSAGGGNGGTQSSGGTGANNGSFGIGGNGGAAHNSGRTPGGAGGGWYGGGGGTARTGTGGGGGSGFIFTTPTNITGYLLTPRYMLTEAATISGNTTFNSPTGEIVIGHSGHGYARITLISED